MQHSLNLSDILKNDRLNEEVERDPAVTERTNSTADNLYGAKSLSPAPKSPEKRCRTTTPGLLTTVAPKHATAIPQLWRYLATPGKMARLLRLFPTF